jgi:hypothetical protein
LKEDRYQLSSILPYSRMIDDDSTYAPMSYDKGFNAFNSIINYFGARTAQSAILPACPAIHADSSS